MRISIPRRIVILLNLVAIGVGVTTAWLSAEVAGDRAEQHLLGNAVENAARLMERLRLPASGPMMSYLSDVLSAETVAVAADGNAILGSSLPPELAAQLAAALPPEGQSLRVRLDGHEFHVGSARAQARAPDGVLAPVRLAVAVPSSRVQEARRRIARRVAVLAVPVVVLGSVIGAAVSLTVTRPLDRLSMEAERLRDRLSRSEESVDEQLDGTMRSALGKAPPEILALATAFDQLLTSLHEAERRLVRVEQLAALGRVAATVAHELRNPLSGVAMHLRLLKDRFDESDTDRETVKRIEREIERMDLYIGELMLLARDPDTAEPGTLQRPGATADAADTVKQSLELLAPRCSHADITIRQEMEGDLPAIHIGTAPLRQVLLNLLVNAIEAMPDGGTLGVRVSADAPGRIRFETSDTGPGVQAPPDQDILEPFVSTKVGGAGIGLHVCKRIVEAHGGRIGYDTSSEGTTFWLVLPADDGQPESET